MYRGRQFSNPVVPFRRTEMISEAAAHGDRDFIVELSNSSDRLYLTTLVMTELRPEGEMECGKTRAEPWAQLFPYASSISVKGVLPRRIRLWRRSALGMTFRLRRFGGLGGHSGGRKVKKTHRGSVCDKEHASVQRAARLPLWMRVLYVAVTIALSSATWITMFHPHDTGIR